MSNEDLNRIRLFIVTMAAEGNIKIEEYVELYERIERLEELLDK